MGTLSVSLSDGDLLIGPCRSQRLGRRQELGIGQAGPGTKEIIGKVWIPIRNYLY